MQYLPNVTMIVVTAHDNKNKVSHNNQAICQHTFLQHEETVCVSFKTVEEEPGLVVMETMKLTWSLVFRIYERQSSRVD